MASGWRSSEPTEKLAREADRGHRSGKRGGSLKAAGISRRFGLNAEVPCAGTRSAGTCKLLSDAPAAAQPASPGRRRRSRSHGQRVPSGSTLRDIEERGRGLTAAPAGLKVAEETLKRERTVARLSLRAASQESSGKLGNRSRVSSAIESLSARGEETVKKKRAGRDRGD